MEYPFSLLDRFFPPLSAQRHLSAADDLFLRGQSQLDKAGTVPGHPYDEVLVLVRVTLFQNSARPVSGRGDSRPLCLFCVGWYGGTGLASKIGTAVPRNYPEKQYSASMSN